MNLKPTEADREFRDEMRSVFANVPAEIRERVAGGDCSAARIT